MKTTVFFVNKRSDVKSLEQVVNSKIQEMEEDGWEVNSLFPTTTAGEGYIFFCAYVVFTKELADTPTP